MLSYSNQEIEHGAVSYLNYPFTLTTKKMAEEKIEVPNFEATSDEKEFSIRNNGSKDFDNTPKENTKWI